MSRPAYCENCYSPLRPLAAEGTSWRYWCGPCRQLLVDHERILRELKQRQEDALEAAIPLEPIAPEEPLVVEGLLDSPKPGTGWIIRWHHQLAYLAYQTSPEIDFYRETRPYLARLYPNVKAYEWDLLLA